ncbi:MAG: hypothetical protein NTZ16_01680 [Verrucomicrobia bacterium]|nr:hypothetical protein [Verrucomicrobiota bacterium]
MKLPTLCCIAALLLVSGLTAVRAAEMRLEAQLIWASNTAQSPNPKHKPVDAEVRRKLAGLPLKWTHFFEENRKPIRLTAAPQKVELSDKSAVEVRQLPADKVQVTLFGNGKEIWKGVQPLPKNEILVLGGNAPADSAWLVTLKRIE